MCTQCWASIGITTAINTFHPHLFGKLCAGVLPLWRVQLCWAQSRLRRLTKPRAKFAVASRCCPDDYRFRSLGKESSRVGQMTAICSSPLTPLLIVERKGGNKVEVCGRRWFSNRLLRPSVRPFSSVFVVLISDFKYLLPYRPTTTMTPARNTRTFPSLHVCL